MLNISIKKEVNNIINFIKQIERLKDTKRTAWTKEGRLESTAEHSWRLAVFAMLIENYFDNIDSKKLIKMSLIHDLGEAHEGDISAILDVDQKEKIKQEKESFKELTSLLPDEKKDDLLSIWQEYNAGNTAEARLVKALDKMETIIQHNQGDNPENFNYKFNLEYGTEYSDSNSILKIMRKLIDKDTRRKMS